MMAARQLYVMIKQLGLPAGNAAGAMLRTKNFRRSFHKTSPGSHIVATYDAQETLFCLYANLLSLVPADTAEADLRLSPREPEELRSPDPLNFELAAAAPPCSGAA